MKAAVLYEHGKPLVIEEVELAPPKEREVRVRIEATGVCHSDLHLRNGGFPVYQLPTVPGHEAAGIITEVGPGVTRVAEGDHVIVMWIPWCGECWHCKKGEVIHCPDVSRRYGVKFDGTSRLSLNGSPLSHGLDAATFAEEAVFHENAVVKIDQEVPFEIAALIGCAVGTGVGAVLNTADVQPGDRIAVIGCGGVGLNIVQGGRIADASRIIAIDVVPEKLAAAESFGATDKVNASDTDPISAVMEITDGVGVDFAFEAIGNAATQQQTLRMIRRGGYAVFVGVAPLFDPLPITAGLMTLMGHSILSSYFGSVQPDRDFPNLISLWREGKLDLEGLISDRGSLQDINDAFAKMERGALLRQVIYPAS